MNHSNVEIERKYLLGRYPEAELASGGLRLVERKHIYQTYLAFSGDQEIRIRKLVVEAGEAQGTEQYTHTFKRGTGLSREEIEYPISRQVYEQLLGLGELVPLQKTRTTVEDRNGRLFDMDDYAGLQLLTVEAEFASEQEALSFQPPEWFGRELGNEEEFRNKKLWLDLQTSGIVGRERKE
ncbi:CYTH domain-containing protein [Paenibacillus protaetiae]|uniref:CYTH domain-containing protein n=1 Tax=Paenibacillus protaetiae TaxID=2509456 RepID=A0A4P6EWV5_9BACL|nr:CYTH domain-containing protein [Paenibacillus protaetiae]QAY65067.1 CYTH domain-containing protein [Paenibacillus protaetiae]